MTGAPRLAGEWNVGIVVPARNEQGRIARCVRSVLAAADASDARSVQIVVVADRCDDRTACIAREVLKDRGRVIETNAGSPGKARRLGTDAVLSDLAGIEPKHVWLANTDADGYVPAEWIQTQLRMASEGAPAVAGIVEVDSFRTHGPNGVELFRQHYVINEDGTHPHVHGANIGVRADVYLDAGGWSDIPVGEDHCLWRRVQERGWMVRSSTTSFVTTSGRLRGRARGGFADTLRSRLRASVAAEGAAT